MAATKCRLRKLERISVLDNEASKLRVENELLSKTTENLKQKACNIDDSWCALWGLIFILSSYFFFCDMNIILCCLQVSELKQELRWHINNGCKVWRPDNDSK